MIGQSKVIQIIKAKCNKGKDRKEKQLRQKLLLMNTRMWDVGLVQKTRYGGVVYAYCAHTQHTQARTEPSHPHPSSTQTFPRPNGDGATHEGPGLGA